MSTATAAEPLLTIACAARDIGVATWTLRWLAKAGRIPVVRIAHIMRVRLSDVRGVMSEG